MAALSATDRQRTCNQWMRDNLDTLGGVSKAQLRAAVDAVDDWVETNATALNTAIPLPARAELTTAQKGVLYAYVFMRKAGRLRAQED